MKTLFEERHVKPKTGRALIVGSMAVNGRPDRRKMYENVVGVDMRHGPGVDTVMNFEEEECLSLGTFDHIECLSVMEHSKRPWLMAANIEKALKPSGTLHVEVPFNWWQHNYPDDYFRVTTSGLKVLFSEIDWVAVLYSGCGLLAERSKDLPNRKIDGHRFYGQSMTCGFGVKR